MRATLPYPFSPASSRFTPLPQFWEEVFDKGYNVHPTSIVDVWLSFTEVDAVVAAGNNVVISYGLYLDQQTPVGPTHYFWADTWMNFWVRFFFCCGGRAWQLLFLPSFISPLH